MTSTFDRLMVRAEDLKAEHIKFKFEDLSVVTTPKLPMFVFGDVSKAFDISSAGMWFLCYRLGDQLTPDEEAQLWELWKVRHSYPHKFVDAINMYRQFQIDAGDKRDFYILTLVEQHMMSVLTNYNPLFNTEILAWVKGNNLTDNLLWGDVGWESAHFFLKLDTQDDVHVGLHIVNGETGRVAFSYTAFVRTNGGYVYNWPVHAKRRHLSLIGDAKGKLHDALAEISQLKVYDIMRTVRVRDIPDLTITKNYEKIADSITPNMNVIQLMAALSGFENQHGYKGLVKEVLNKAMKTVESLIS